MHTNQDYRSQCGKLANQNVIPVPVLGPESAKMMATLSKSSLSEFVTRCHAESYFQSEKDLFRGWKCNCHKLIKFLAFIIFLLICAHQHVYGCAGVCGSEREHAGTNVHMCRNERRNKQEDGKKIKCFVFTHAYLILLFAHFAV